MLSKQIPIGSDEYPNEKELFLSIADRWASDANLVIPPKSPRLRESGLLDEFRSRSFATLRMTARDFVILSVAKDLWQT
jgi:hypothetical protein